MPITVGEVVELPEIQRGEPEVLCDLRWDDEIRWLHIGDVPDLSGLLQGGELVLTTGAALANWPHRYLESVSQAGAIGVIVELGATLPHLPSAVADLARRERLALVALHRAVRFVDVTEAVHRRLVAEQYEAVAFDRQVHQTFTELSMQRADVDAIVAAAGRMLNAPVVLEDLAHQVLALRPTAEFDAGRVLADWESRSRRQATPTPSSPTPPSPSSPTRAAREAWTSVAVGPRGEVWGRLIVPQHTPSSGRVVTVLERAAVALALHHMIERDRTGLHQRAQSGLLDDVLERRLTDKFEVAARAHALGVARAPQYVPVVTRLDQPGGPADPVAAQRRRTEQLEAVGQAIRAGGHSGLFTVRRDGDIDALIAPKIGRGATVEVALADIARRIEGAVGRLDSATGCVIAVGEGSSQIVHAIDGLVEAAHVAEVAAAMSGPRRSFYRAADVRLRGLIAVLKHDPRVQTFAETELRTLLTEPELLDVLRHFLQCNGNKADLAHRMHISRPALYKRLGRIENALGVDLSDAESTLSLHVALLIHDARGPARG